MTRGAFTTEQTLITLDTHERIRHGCWRMTREFKPRWVQTKFLAYQG